MLKQVTEQGEDLRAKRDHLMIRSQNRATYRIKGEIIESIDTFVHAEPHACPAFVPKSWN